MSNDEHGCVISYWRCLMFSQHNLQLDYILLELSYDHIGSSQHSLGLDYILLKSFYSYI